MYLAVTLDDQVERIWRSRPVVVRARPGRLQVAGIRGGRPVISVTDMAIPDVHPTVLGAGSQTGPGSVRRGPEARLGWPATFALHLGPAAAAFAAALMLAPLLDRFGLPENFALTVAFLLVLTPIELGLLLHAAWRAGGRRSLRSLALVLEFRRPLGRWWLAVPILFAAALGLAAVWTPVGAALGGRLAGVYPAWLLPAHDATAGHSRVLVVAALLISLLVDGLINPTVEELYFRGYLLPRLPVAGWRAVPLSALLFAVQHYWQPYNWALIFVLWLLITSLVVRSHSLRLGIVMHTLANCTGILLTLAAVVD